MKNFSPETLQEALDLWDQMGDLNKDGIKILIDAVRAGEALAEVADSILHEESGEAIARLTRALDAYFEVVVGDGVVEGVSVDTHFEKIVDAVDVCGYSPDITRWTACSRDRGHVGPHAHRPAAGASSPYVDTQVLSSISEDGRFEHILEIDAKGLRAALNTPSYQIEILDQGFEPGSYGGWTVQFKAIGAPRLSYQKSDPILDAFIPLERAPDDAKQLEAGGSGSALARTDDEAHKLTEAMMGGGQEGNVLRGFTGAAVVEVAPVVHGNAPVALPSDERIIEACQKSIRAHCAAVAEEQKRLAVTESGEGIVGKKLTVKG